MRLYWDSEQLVRNIMCRIVRQVRQTAQDHARTERNERVRHRRKYDAAVAAIQGEFLYLPARFAETSSEQSRFFRTRRHEKLATIGLRSVEMVSDDESTLHRLVRHCNVLDLPDGEWYFDVHRHDKVVDRTPMIVVMSDDCLKQN